MLFSFFLILTVLGFFNFLFICFYMFSEQSTTKPEGLYEEHIGNFRMAIPLIMINIILFILLTYGCYHMEWFTFTGYNPTNTTIVSDLRYVELTDYTTMVAVFLVMVMIHILLLFKNFYDILREGTYRR